MPSRKADLLTLASRYTMHRYILSVATYDLVQENGFQFWCEWLAFAEMVTYVRAIYTLPIMMSAHALQMLSLLAGLVYTYQ